ncbi:PadR family transcriptional regulator [Actinoplanes sp. OR16]|uniref:PadR family transcriptional regulator n=1 Tax=Actinoplanes sp. OR16 TaxID=946334 RepID=UPI000F703DBD|nr:PadR family transcriptional regulator [Actinoplanes sp. OR16]BBH69691.1 PadR family transcriptional regulator [Actinoplanes sp. OR16]
MIRKADRDLTSLTVLALLTTGPRHTYEMHLFIERTHKTFVTGLPRSLYHAVNRLLAAGDIVVTGTLRDPGRPERTVYALTDQGRARLRDWVRLLLAVPDPDATLLTAALNYAGCLPPDEVADALHDRRAELTRSLQPAKEALGLDLPRILLLEVEFEVARLTAELAWTTSILDDLDTGRLTWPPLPGDVADLEPLLREET